MPRIEQKKQNVSEIEKIEYIVFAKLYGIAVNDIAIFCVVASCFIFSGR
jgi:cytidylate kinase